MGFENFSDPGDLIHSIVYEVAKPDPALHKQMDKAVAAKLLPETIFGLAGVPVFEVQGASVVELKAADE